MKRWDAPVWAGLLVITLALGAMGCLGVAAAEAGQPMTAEIVSTGM
jgi:hypothetical protein